MGLFNSKKSENTSNRSGFAVLGLGLFGSAIAKNLGKSGEDVIAIDKREHRVEEVTSFVTKAVIADTTDIAALREAGIASVKTAVVSIGNDLESAVLTIMNLKDLGIPEIIAKSKNGTYEAVLRKIGVDEVINPEEEMGFRVAERLMNPNMSDLVDLSHNCMIAEIKTPKRWLGKNLRELELRSRYGINVIGFKDKDKNRVDINVLPDRVLAEDDILVLIGDKDTLNALDLF